MANHLTIVRQRQQLIEQSNQIEAMRQRDKQRFEKINSTKDQFVNSAVHDLKNPLSLVTGYASLMRSFPEIRSSPQSLECLASIEASGEQMLSLVTSMLDLIRMQASLDLTLETVKVTPFVAEQVQMHMLNADEKNIKIHLAQPDEPLFIDIDRNLMKRVIDNLLSNAIKYSPPDTMVSILITPEGDEVAIHVVDEGFGIPQKDIPEII